MINAICVYCGASAGTSPHYAEAARALASKMVEQHIALIYGGGKVGLMGIIADEVMRLGGDVTGVIPTALLDKEVGHTSLTRLHVVKDMHERKAMMAQLADAFIALPGGIGTLEELFEVMTWSQLGFHDKPIGLLNTLGFYDGLIGFLNHVATHGFLRVSHQQLLMHDVDGANLIARFHSHVPGRIEKLLDEASVKMLLP